MIIIEIALVGFLVGYLFLASPYNVVRTLTILLPFHMFIKSSLYYFIEGGSIFAFWKEIAVILLAFKIIQSGKSIINPKLIGVMGFYVFVTLVYFVIAKSYGDALAKMRDNIFTMLLFLAASKCDFTEKEIKGIFKAFIVAAFISAIAGFLQQFVFNILISTLKGSIDFIDEAGYIQYKTVSTRIMGFERMSGLLSGPNDFGLYCSFAFCMCIYLLFAKSKIDMPVRFRQLMMLTTVMLLICLLFSFSRAGWAISIFTIGYLLATKAITFNPKVVFLAFTIFFIVISSAIIFVPKISAIVDASLSGKEASAAARATLLEAALNRIMEEPYGHGLASADNRSKTSEFFTESSFINIAFEIGVIGLINLILLHLNIIQLLRVSKVRRNSIFAPLAVGISISALIASFVSINPSGTPFIYLWWLILGLGMNQTNTTTQRNHKDEILHNYSHI